MKPNTLLFLQSVLVFLQMGNVAVDTLPQPWPVLIAAFVGAFQFYVSHLSNQSIPEPRVTVSDAIRAINWPPPPPPPEHGSNPASNISGRES